MIVPYVEDTRKYSVADIMQALNSYETSFKFITLCQIIFPLRYSNFLQLPELTFFLNYVVFLTLSGQLYLEIE